MSENVTSIGYYAFQYCEGPEFTSVTIPESVTTIGYKAFEKVPLTNVTFLGSAITNFGNNAFPSGFYLLGDDKLRTAYEADGVGTYTRGATGYPPWTKQP
jgi:hypothetical protein